MKFFKSLLRALLIALGVYAILKSINNYTAFHIPDFFVGFLVCAAYHIDIKFKENKH